MTASPPRPRFRRSWRRTLPLAAALLGVLPLAACYTPGWQTIPANAPQAEVQSKLGRPHETYPLGGGVTRWLYPTQPFGQQTIAADIDAQGRVVGVKQVLSMQEFAKVEVGKWTKDDILHHFGKPVETSYFPLMKREAWTYRFKQDEAWDSMMNFYFDPQGIVRMTQISPDPLKQKESHGLF
ncbi:lipoprotein [Pandoraea terrae]|uniref:Lipoprotein n=1 Tax=Pandoraea terrae TaxID=1537710 RepID=A0A5E4WK30_9BURK|nr:lipoprotein [Pandoraea terrae]